MQPNFRIGFILTVGLCASATPSEASAMPDFPGQIPNGNRASCGTCHINPAGGGPRNAFGLDVQSNLVGGQPRWQSIYRVDSDNDGQTNGEELGDPCGEWSPGDAPPRTTNISRPGDPASTSATPDQPGCTPAVDAGFVDAGAPADAGVSPPADAGVGPSADTPDAYDEGGCACAVGSSGDDTLGWGLLVGGALVFIGLRRRTIFKR